MRKSYRYCNGMITGRGHENQMKMQYSLMHGHRRTVGAKISFEEDNLKVADQANLIVSNS